MEEFGGRDHTTVLHAHEKITTDVEESEHLKGKINHMVKEIKGE